MPTKNKTQKLVPELRFPEFRGAGEWEECSLGSAAKVANKKVTTKSVSLNDYATTENILPDFRGFGSASNLPNVKSITQFLPGDTLFANIRPYLKKAVFATRPGGASNDVIVFRSRDNVSPEFLSLRIRSDAFVDYVMSGAKGLKMPRGDVEQMKVFPFPLPTPSEQQKIADCLGSLDELLAAHRRKLAALQDHKKGLLQQLFPAEGETTPNLRFPEFEGEWEIVSLGEIAKFESGGTPAKNEASYWNGEIPWISASSMHDTFVDDSELRVTTAAIGNGTRIAKKGTLLILVRGSMLFNRVPLCLALRDVAFNQDVKALILKKGINSLFLLSQLVSFKSRIPVNRTGIGAGKIDTEDLKALELFIPSLPEQQKIADCLSALDALITAQTDQIAALQAHKKGLMQQLFPSGEQK